LNGTIINGPLWKALVWHNIERLPLRKLLGKACPDQLAVFILGTRRAIATFPLVTPALAALGSRFNTALENDGIKLLAHSAGLRLPLDLVATNDATAVGKWARAVTVRDGA